MQGFNPAVVDAILILWPLPTDVSACFHYLGRFTCGTRIDPGWRAVWGQQAVQNCQRAIDLQGKRWREGKRSESIMKRIPRCLAKGDLVLSLGKHSLKNKYCSGFWVISGCFYSISDCFHNCSQSSPPVLCDLVNCLLLSFLHLSTDLRA